MGFLISSIEGAYILANRFVVVFGKFIDEIGGESTRFGKQEIDGRNPISKEDLCSGVESINLGGNIAVSSQRSSTESFGESQNDYWVRISRKIENSFRLNEDLLLTMGVEGPLGIDE